MYIRKKLTIWNWVVNCNNCLACLPKPSVDRRSKYKFKFLRPLHLRKSLVVSDGDLYCLNLWERWEVNHLDNGDVVLSSYKTTTENPKRLERKGGAMFRTQICFLRPNQLVIGLKFVKTNPLYWGENSVATLIQAHSHCSLTRAIFSTAKESKIRLACPITWLPPRKWPSILQLKSIAIIWFQFICFTLHCRD